MQKIFVFFNFTKMQFINLLRYLYYLKILQILESEEAINHKLNEVLNFLFSKFNMGKETNYFGQAYTEFVKKKMIDDTKIAKILNENYRDAAQKLEEYRNIYELKDFLKSCETFDPMKFKAKPLNFDKFFQGLIASNDIKIQQLQNEYKMYAETVKFETEDPKVVYWKSSKLGLPLLSKFAGDYLSFPISNCSVERSFSQYRYIFSDLRKSFKDIGLKCHMFFAYNKELIMKIYRFKYRIFYRIRFSGFLQVKINTVIELTMKLHFLIFLIIYYRHLIYPNINNSCTMMCNIK